MTDSKTLASLARRAFGLTSLAALLTAGTLMAAGPAGATPTAAPTTDKLYATQVLTGGHSLVSAGGGEYQLLMQTDGNLVEYAFGQALWSTGTAGHPGARLTVQTDGNIVIYSATNQPLWQNHRRFAGGSYLQVATQGSLYQEDSQHIDEWVVWWMAALNSTLPSGDRLQPGWALHVQHAQTFGSLTMQTDGNLVVMVDGAIRWTSHTARNPGANLVMQSDGNLVIYSAAGKPLWNTRTSGNPGAYVTIQNPGYHLNVVAPGGRVLWSSTDTGPVG